MASTHTVVKTSDGWIVDEIYDIQKNGAVWYTHWHTGKRKAFPEWLFELKKKIEGEK